MNKILVFGTLCVVGLFLLIVFGIALSPKNEFHERCKLLNGVVVQDAMTVDLHCIDRSIIKASK